MKHLIYFLIIPIFVILLAYGGYKFNRWWNWSLGYEKMVEQKIEQMVKPECLK